MKGKVIFIDGVSNFDRPIVEKEFESEPDLSCLLREYGYFNYAYTAEIYVDNIKIMKLHITDRGFWAVE